MLLFVMRFENVEVNIKVIRAVNQYTVILARNKFKENLGSCFDLESELVASCTKIRFLEVKHAHWVGQYFHTIANIIENICVCTLHFWELYRAVPYEFLNEFKWTFRAFIDVVFSKTAESKIKLLRLTFRLAVRQELLVDFLAHANFIPPYIYVFLVTRAKYRLQ